jgi:hypothetical protein
VSSVVSAGVPFVVKVEALPPLWRGSYVFGEAQCGICCHVLCVSWDVSMVFVDWSDFAFCLQQACCNNLLQAQGGRPLRCDARCI